MLTNKSTFILNKPLQTLCINKQTCSRSDYSVVDVTTEIRSVIVSILADCFDIVSYDTDLYRIDGT